MRPLPPKAAYLVILATEGFGRGILFAALVSYWVVEARLNPLELVLLGTAIESTLFVFQIPTGAFADSVGRRPATVIGYALLGVGLGAQGLTKDFFALLGLQALAGVAWAFLAGSVEAWISGAAPAEPFQRLFLRGGQVQLAGIMTGLLVTLALGQFEPRLPIFVGGGLLVVVSVGAALLMGEERVVVAGAPQARMRQLITVAGVGVGVVRADRTLWLLALMSFTLGLSTEGWDRLYTAHFFRDLGLGRGSQLSPLGWLALIGLVECVFGTVAFEVAARRRAGGPPGRLVAVLCVTRAVLMAAFAAISALPPALIVFVAAETIRRLGDPIIDAWVARETPPDVRTTVLSTAGQAESLGEIVAGPVIGVLGNLTSVSVSLGTSAALLLPAAMLAIRAERRSAP